MVIGPVCWPWLKVVLFLLPPRTLTYCLYLELPTARPKTVGHTVTLQTFFLCQFRLLVSQQPVLLILSWVCSVIYSHLLNNQTAVLAVVRFLWWHSRLVQCNHGNQLAVLFFLDCPWLDLITKESRCSRILTSWPCTMLSFAWAVGLIRGNLPEVHVTASQALQVVAADLNP